MYKVSIIIPVYNVEKYLSIALYSVINQTLKDIEIICVDDKSTDNSLNILKEYAQKDNRIKIIEQQVNLGPGLARNVGIDIAQGEYIMFFDPDDWYELNACEELYKQIKENQLDFLEFNYNIYQNDTKTFIQKAKKYEYKENVIYNNIIFEHAFLLPLFGLNKIFCKEFLIKNNIRYSTYTKMGEDHIVTIKSRLLAQRKMYSDTIYYHYRKGIKSLTSQKRNVEAMKIFDVIDEIEKFLIELNCLDKVKKQWRWYKIKFIKWNTHRIPITLTFKFIKKIKGVLNKQEFQYWIYNILSENGKNILFWLLFNLFSISRYKHYKVIYILGIKIKLKQKEQYE